MTGERDGENLCAEVMMKEEDREEKRGVERMHTQPHVLTIGCVVYYEREKR